MSLFEAAAAAMEVIHEDEKREEHDRTEDVIPYQEIGQNAQHITHRDQVKYKQTSEIKKQPEPKEQK